MVASDDSWNIEVGASKYKVLAYRAIYLHDNAGSRVW
jgi:hypothetical protein